ncbi:hydroxyacylglutathione hydrolase [Paraglaciecola aquimarina]|uniref:Hydroxyacylglutathione hydrolase n=1 Tax=Paraglaciecola aquimarina TaxID=1235557 RepID=A0ABU3SZG0_9ALTE|nr:hydroxyacylglutathione hydrolase [Paraglaciecola aquimarina]MDU0355404.1 hydroxyacylglutathione hydrolase [Paraglaciecola aquimarina]
MSLQIIAIKAFSDNYIWCLRNHQYCVVVDPGDGAPVKEYCQRENLSVTAILITHHHWDHTDGIDELLKTYPDIAVYGPQNNNIKQINSRLNDKDIIQLRDIDVALSVMTVLGHTLDHIAYYGDIGLFCGDTLFSAGCGRLLEGSAQQMFDSLKKLATLPTETKVFCTHEYTLANINFALAAEPNNKVLHNYKRWAEQQRSQNLATLPSSIGQELAINPFLRCHSAELAEQVQKHSASQLNSPQAVFAALRRWKDHF